MKILTFREWLDAEFDAGYVYRLMDHTERRRELFEQYVHEQIQKLADALIHWQPTPPPPPPK